MHRLTKAFYERDALAVARELIGCLFCRSTKRGLLAVRLVETEAYRGPIDPGSHGYRGVTDRTRVMYGPPGRLYVYFTYGMHWCANVVCAREGTCEAVLLRAGEPVFGTDILRMNRGGITRDRLIASGPARLAQAFGIAKGQNGASLLRGGDFWCAEDADTQSLRTGEIAQTVRIGLGEGRGQEIPWRFVVPGHPHASRRS
ncbi:MAG TPA: DNA-3-methyladenine glycosylase [Actinomycetota bacterium]|nr:DNA-3-methyladenine glycosylase [Actinomycetota bacterium]